MIVISYKILAHYLAAETENKSGNLTITSN
jgi:thymidylate synthase